MILGIDKVSDLIKRKNLVDGLDEEDQNFEGCGVDLRIGEIYEMEEGDGFLHIETRDSPKYKSVGKFNGKKGVKIKIEPGKVYLGKTIETINTPEDLFGWFLPRATFYRCGIIVQGIRTDPGYSGNFVFMMSNISQKPFVIELGARIANMVFHRVDGKPNLYKGQWQGGRAFIEKEEKQVKQRAKTN